MSIIKINIIEVASELAEKEMRKEHGDYHYDNVFCKEVDEITVYTEEGQDIFNDLYDEYYSFIENLEEK